MDITLEKIELVKDRTGVTYKEAKEALEKAGGNVVDAIIEIEDNVNCDVSQKASAKKDALIAQLKDAVKKGNVSKIIVTKDGEQILNIPLTVGIIGTVLAPWGMIAATVAAFGFKCKIKLVKTDGTEVDLNEKADGIYESAKEKSSGLYEEFKDKAPKAAKNVKEKFSRCKDDFEDMVDVEYCHQDDCHDCQYPCTDIDDIQDKAEKVAKDIQAKVDQVSEDTKDMVSDGANAIDEQLEEINESDLLKK